MPLEQGAVAGIAVNGGRIGLPEHSHDALSRCYECQVRLLAMVAHDLKSPLNIIVGVGEALRRRLTRPGVALDKDELLADLDTLLLVGADMGHLIEKLVSSAHMESGQVVLEFAEVDDLQSVLRGVAEAFRVKAERHGVSLRADLTAPLPTVNWDICAIQYHILNNILANALKYTGVGGIVELRGRVDGDRVVIEVADNGPGIPEDQRAKVFDRFERLALKHERVYQGAGLGLYNAQLLARQHGGEIGIEDGIGGRGVTFSVSLPIRPASVGGC